MFHLVSYVFDRSLRNLETACEERLEILRGKKIKKSKTPIGVSGLGFCFLIGDAMKWIAPSKITFHKLSIGILYLRLRGEPCGIIMSSLK